MLMYFIKLSLKLFSDVLDIDIKDIGLISAIPAVCGLIVQPFFAYLADVLRSRNVFSVSEVIYVVTNIIIYVQEIVISLESNLCPYSQLQHYVDSILTYITWV